MRVARSSAPPATAWVSGSSCASTSSRKFRTCSNTSRSSDSDRGTSQAGGRPPPGLLFSWDRSEPTMEQVGAGPPAPESTTFVLEEKRRLSDSLIWRLQRDFYSQKGEEAWLTGRTPYYVTSNAFIANAYARVIAGFLRDCAGATSNLGPLDPKAPVYILEVASGSGKFGFLFLKKLL